MRSRTFVALLVAISFIGCSRPRERYLIPNGYAGWLCVSYEVRSAPELPVEGGYRLVTFPASGVVETSTPPLPGHEYRDQYFYYDGKIRRAVDLSKELGGGFTHQDSKNPGRVTFQFWISPDASADYRAYVENRRSECGPFKQYRRRDAS